MPYAYSSLDKENLKWFAKDNTRQSLTGIELKKGKMRGLKPFSLEFTYPITAIAGANGAGKSTLLAMVACAFHNYPKGYRPPSRKHSYYTFSDFFVQSVGEVGPQGVEIDYWIRHDNWQRKDPGEFKQTRRKLQGGRWNDYQTRVDRNVVYFGVQRVVPFFERSTHKSYRARFKSATMTTDLRNRIAKLASRIFGKTYSDFESLEHSKYSLPKVQKQGVSYSGFNMGAGESAVFEILATLFAAGEGCLLVIDEIELGLHELAQVRLIKVLKELCNELKCQVICTTHSYEILASLPPAGRMYIESLAGNTQILPGISADYACGKMGRRGSQELDIFVEDEVAKTIVDAALNLELRERCQVLEIGSHASLKRLMAARYMEKRRSCLCVFDGDQRSHFKKSKSEIANFCDGKFSEKSNEIQKWADDRLDYLPGKEWPEKWLFEQAIGLCIGTVGDWERSPASDWSVPNDVMLCGLLEQGLNAGKHNEFSTLASSLSLPMEIVRSNLIAALHRSIPDEFDALADRIQGLLD